MCQENTHPQGVFLFFFFVCFRFRGFCSVGSSGMTSTTKLIVDELWSSSGKPARNWSSSGPDADVFFSALVFGVAFGVRLRGSFGVDASSCPNASVDPG